NVVAGMGVADQRADECLQVRFVLEKSLKKFAVCVQAGSSSFSTSVVGPEIGHNFFSLRWRFRPSMRALDRLIRAPRAMAGGGLIALRPCLVGWRRHLGCSWAATEEDRIERKSSGADQKHG